MTVRLSDIDAVLRAHMPSITDEIEDELADRIAAASVWDGEGDGDSADCALRVCSCGVRIDGYYEYTDHLSAMVHKAWTEALVGKLIPPPFDPVIGR